MVETEKGRAHEMECKRRNNMATGQQGEFRDGLAKKPAFLLDFVQITFPPTPPPSPQFGQLVHLFSDVKIQDSKVSLELKILYIIYII